MSNTLKTVVFWIVIGVTAMLLWQVTRASREDRRVPEISYSRFITEVEAGSVESVTIAGTQIRGQYRDGKEMFHLTGPVNAAAYLDTLRNKGVEIRFRDEQSGLAPLQLLGTWAPLILLGALWLLLIRLMQRKNSLPPGSMPPGEGVFGPSGGPR